MNMERETTLVDRNLALYERSMSGPVENASSLSTLVLVWSGTWPIWFANVTEGRVEQCNILCTFTYDRQEFDKQVELSKSGEPSKPVFSVLWTTTKAWASLSSTIRCRSWGDCGAAFPERSGETRRNATVAAGQDPKRHALQLGGYL